MKMKAAFLFCVLLFIAGCGSDKPEAPAPAAAPGRTETRGLEAAGAAGYDGAGVRRSVDKMLNQNDARNAETKRALDQASEK
jgi:hypothetical protein